MTATALVVAIIPAGARGASFTLSPIQSVASSGVGPFDWSFQSTSNPNGYTGWVGYKLSTESTWHRCLGQSSHVELRNLPDGTYSVEIADDVNVEYLAANGTSNSGLNTCGNPSLAPPGGISQDSIVIDSTPPAVAARAW